MGPLERPPLTLRLFESGFPDSEGVEVTLPIELGTGLVPATHLDEGWKTNRMLGLYFDPGNGWIYHPDLKWLFLWPEVIDGGLYLWSPDTGWIWTRENLFPSFWHYQGNAGAGTWIRWARGTRDPAWFYDYSLNDGEGGWMNFGE